MCNTLNNAWAAAMKIELRQKLQTAFYSLNIDEATNNSMDKVVNIIIRYFDGADEEVKTEHFSSSIVNQATAENIHQAVVESLKDECPGPNPLRVSPMNMTSCLMDNCATMRGVKAGVEPRLRKDNSHLLDISGDTVHTVANAAKRVFKPF